MGNVLEGEEFAFQNLYEAPFRSTTNIKTKKRSFNECVEKSETFFSKKASVKNRIRLVEKGGIIFRNAVGNHTFSHHSEL